MSFCLFAQWEATPTLAPVPTANKRLPKGWRSPDFDPVKGGDLDSVQQEAKDMAAGNHGDSAVPMIYGRRAALGLRSCVGVGVLLLLAWVCLVLMGCLLFFLNKGPVVFSNSTNASAASRLQRVSFEAAPDADGAAGAALGGCCVAYAYQRVGTAGPAVRTVGSAVRNDGDNGDSSISILVERVSNASEWSECCFTYTPSNLSTCMSIVPSLGQLDMHVVVNDRTWIKHRFLHQTCDAARRTVHEPDEAPSTGTGSGNGSVVTGDTKGADCWNCSSMGLRCGHFIVSEECGTPGSALSLPSLPPHIIHTARARCQALVA